MTTWYEVLRNGRKEAHLTLQDVESRIDVSNQHISDIERGKILNPSFAIIMKLCILYGISPNALYRMVEESQE